MTEAVTIVVKSGPYRLIKKMSKEMCYIDRDRTPGNTVLLTVYIKYSFWIKSTM